MAIGRQVPLAQRQLGRELLRLRRLAGLDQRVIAELIGSSQAMVSRVERAEKSLPLPTVLAWGEACGANEKVLGRLTELAEAASTQTEAWRDLMAAAPQLQDAVRVNEAATRTLLTYSSTVVPGLLQTPSYAANVLRLTNYTGQMDEAAALAGRWRRQEALTDRTRRFDFMVPEAVLRWSPAGSDVLVAQLERLMAIAGQDNISFGVIMSGQETVLPFHGFVIYADRDDEDPFVTVELVHTYLTVSYPADVALYHAAFDKLRSAALNNEETVALIRQLLSSIELK